MTSGAKEWADAAAASDAKSGHTARAAPSYSVSRLSARLPSAVLALQRAAGNRATSAVLSGAGAPSAGSRAAGVLARPQYRDDALIVRSLRRAVLAREPEPGTVPHQMWVDPPNDLQFCRPYATREEAQAARDSLRANLLPFMRAVFGPEVEDIWRRFLAGGAAVRRTYDDPNHAIPRAFASDAATQADADAIVSEVWAGVHALRLQPGERRTVPLSQLIRSTRRSINYRQPQTIPGNIAGGEGSGDGGVDAREVAGTVEASRSPPASGGWVQRFLHNDITSVWLTLDYTVNDTVDLCPGDPGAPIEQRFTIPLSRLEATGPEWAVDVPYTARFRVERYFDNANPRSSPYYNG